MKHDLDDVFEESTPQELRRRILTDAERRIGKRRRSTVFWPSIALCAAACAGVLVFLLLPERGTRSMAVRPGYLQRDPELILNSRLLLDLDVLERVKELGDSEKSKWRKKKS